jgi:hypothetical protein
MIDAFRKKIIKELKNELEIINVIQLEINSLLQIVSANSKLKKHHLFLSILYLYVSLLGIKIRKLLGPYPTKIKKTSKSKKKNKEVGLLIFLDDLKNHNKVITRSKFCNLYRRAKGGTVIKANKDFDHLVGHGKDLLTKTQIKNDLKKIKMGTKKVRTIVNKSIAHLDRNRRRLRYSGDKKTFEEALDLLSKSINKYHQLVTGDNFPNPSLKDSWGDIFKFPWSK